MQTNRKRSIRNLAVAIWKGWGISLLAAIVIATSFKSAVADWNIVPTGSMKPTIVEGDRIFINKLAWDLKLPYTTFHIAKWADPGHGDIAVFFSPADGKRLVKRVVGVPGDVIEMQQNVITINAKPLTYSLAQPETLAVKKTDIPKSSLCYTEHLKHCDHPVMISPFVAARRSFGPVVIPEGKYFMLGDNRDNSADSRFFGLVDRKRIVGQAIGVVASLDIHDRYLPRWNRFFSSLP
ncbi:MAG: signal peptidase I [Desulfobacteraceae bacterium]|nr:MAG: signal peptidase I [Desulfobacteraceae bacterium]